MPTHTRQRAGHTARANGKIFEEMIFRAAARDNLTTIKIPDSCQPKYIRGKLENVRIRSPFDYVILSQHIAVTLDAKSTTGGSFPFSCIDPHQVRSLADCARDAYRSGYLIWYQDPDLFAFHPVSQLRHVQPRESLRPESGLVIGAGGRLYLDKLFRSETLTRQPTVPTE